MVAALDAVEGGARRQPFQDRLEEVPAREGVARSLDEEHRDRDLRQVPVAERVRPPRRVQGISEKDEAFGRRALGDGLRGDPPAHRLAAEDHRTGAELGPRVIAGRAGGSEPRNASP